MNLPFSPEQFFDVFVRYNESVWPIQLVLNLLAVFAVALVVRGGVARGRAISVVLALLWAWVGIAYHIAFFTSINPAAWLFGGLSLLGALAFAWVGVINARLQFRLSRDLQGSVGAALVTYALIVYPILGYFLDHRYPAAPTFGLPCPLTIFTLGMLLWAMAPVPRTVFVVPILWSAIGSVAAFQLGVFEDLGLLVAGVIGIVAVFAGRRGYAPARRVSAGTR